MQFNFEDWIIRFGTEDAEPMSVPAWFSWAVRLGTELKPKLVDEGRRATLVVTTPCDSAIAGAIALGATLCFVPELTLLGNADDQFDRFMKAPPGTVIKRLPRGSEKQIQRYRLQTERSEERGIAMRKNNERVSRIHFLMKAAASQFAFEATESACGAEKRALAPHCGLSLFKSLLGDYSSTRDWRTSLNAIVLCSPHRGAAALRCRTDQLFFSELIEECKDDLDDDSSVDSVPVRRLTLSDLLSVSQWQPKSDHVRPTYCQFVNASMAGRDIYAESKVVIFNGPDAYLRLNNRFSGQNQVVIVSRDTDANRMERLLGVIHDIRKAAQPFEPSLPEPPFGIQLACLGDRQTRLKQW